MDEAMEEVEEADNESEAGTFDVEDYYARIDSGDAPKDKTIGIATSEELHAVYRELRDSEDVDVDVTESIRNHLRDLAHRHEQEFEKAMRKLEIEREY